jgi:hypothetical protein
LRSSQPVGVIEGTKDGKREGEEMVGKVVGERRSSETGFGVGSEVSMEAGGNVFRSRVPVSPVGSAVSKVGLPREAGMAVGSSVSTEEGSRVLRSRVPGSPDGSAVSEVGLPREAGMAVGSSVSEVGLPRDAGVLLGSSVSVDDGS